MTHNQPNRERANAFDGSNFQAHQIGDVQGRNNVRNAIHSGALLGRALEASLIGYKQLSPHI